MAAQQAECFQTATLGPVAVEMALNLVVDEPFLQHGDEIAGWDGVWDLLAVDVGFLLERKECVRQTRFLQVAVDEIINLFGSDAHLVGWFVLEWRRLVWLGENQAIQDLLVSIQQ